jgi:hypothetical protein
MTCSITNAYVSGLKEGERTPDISVVVDVVVDQALIASQTSTSKATSTTTSPRGSTSVTPSSSSQVPSIFPFVIPADAAPAIADHHHPRQTFLVAPLARVLLGLPHNRAVSGHQLQADVSLCSEAILCGCTQAG